MGMVKSRKVVAIVQARMASSRLPGKVLADIEGEPMLARVVDRARRAMSLDDVVIATTTDSGDSAIVQFCERRDITVFEGHPSDVLDRFYRCASSEKADVIVRITGDCPLIDPDLIDLTTRTLLDADPELDFAANRLPQNRTFPIGLDTEVCSFRALEIAWKEADQRYQREHVMPFIYENENRFRTRIIDYEKNLGKLRWTVDTPEDLELIRQIYRHFGGRDDVSWLEVLRLFDERPDLAKINAGVEHKTRYDVDQRTSD
jgi:spore coat polysaccharide biosynthesis protein SpsF